MGPPAGVRPRRQEETPSLQLGAPLASCPPASGPCTHLDLSPLSCSDLGLASDGIFPSGAWGLPAAPASASYTGFYLVSCPQDYELDLLCNIHTHHTHVMYACIIPTHGLQWVYRRCVRLFMYVHTPHSYSQRKYAPHAHGTHSTHGQFCEVTTYPCVSPFPSRAPGPLSPGGAARPCTVCTHRHFLNQGTFISFPWFFVTRKEMP